MTHLLQPLTNAILAREEDTALQGHGPGHGSGAEHQCWWQCLDLPTLAGLASAPRPAGACCGNRLHLRTRCLGWLSKILSKPTCSTQRVTPFLLPAAAQLGKNPPKFPAHHQRSARERPQPRTGRGAQRNRPWAPQPSAGPRPRRGIYLRPRRHRGQRRD